MESDFQLLLRIALVVLTILITGYCLFKKRKIDFIAIYFFSSILYFFPLLIGEFQAFVFTNDGYYYYQPQNIFFKSYIVLIINSLICFVWLILHERYNNKKEQHSYCSFVLNDHENIIVIFLELLFLLIELYLLYRLKRYIFASTFDKTKLLENTTLLDTIALNVNVFLFVIAFSFSMRWRKITRTLSICLMLYPLFLAKRSEIVLGIIAIMYVWTMKQQYISLWNFLRKKKWLIVGGIILFSAVFLSKAILNYAVQGEWDVVFQYLTKEGVLRESIIYSEPNIITSNLDGIMKASINMEGDSYRFSLFGFIPFIGTVSDGSLIPKDFYSIYQPIVYPELSGWGTANCFLAEAYCNGGWLTLICMVNLVCAILIILERYVIKGKNVFLKGAILSIAPYIMFYIHRNTFYNTIRYIRFYIYLAIVINVIYIFLRIRKDY